MNTTNVTDYENITSSIYVVYDNMNLTNCTDNENNIDINILLYYLQYHVVYHF